MLSKLAGENLIWTRVGITLGFAGETGTRRELGDAFSRMGGGLGHYSARHKLQLGWLENGTEIETVDESGVFTLSPLSSSVAGLKALRVRRAAGSDEWLWVEYRQPIGPYEQYSPEQGFSGALIHYEGPLNKDPQKARTHILDLTPQSTKGVKGLRFKDSRDWDDPALAVGETWQDVFSSLTIEVLSRTSDSLTISVRREPRCVSLSPDSREHGPEAATGSVSISAAPSCSWEVHASDQWVQVTSAMSGSGPGRVAYSIDRNDSTEPRNGTLAIGRRLFRIVQAGVRNHTPRITEVSPSSGTGYVQTFTMRVEDANGVEDLGFVYLDFQSPDGAPRCEVIIDFGSAEFALRADEGLDFVHPRNGRLENKSCDLDLAASTTEAAGIEAVARLHLRFKTGFEGPKTIRARASDRTAFYPSSEVGTWTVGPRPAPSFTPAGLVHSARLDAGDIAEQEIVSLFGLSLADFDADAVLPLGTELGGASVDVTDSQGVTRPCLMLAARVETDVSSAQLNFIIAAGTATGPAILTVRRASGGSHSITINVVEVAPGIFTANSSGSGVPAANAMRFVDGQLTDTYPVFEVTAFPLQATPIDLGPANHQVFLSLFASGIRNGGTVEVTIGGVPMTTIFGPAPSSEFEGLEQLNVLLVCCQ